MMQLYGTPHRQHGIDFPQRCKNCGRLFYVRRSCNGETVVCPYCGARH